MKTGRKITNGPRLYMAADTVNKKYRYPVIIEVIVEGTGKINANALTHAVKTASRANPGTRLVARGKLHGSRLVDTGVTPPVRLIDDSGRHGKSVEGLSIFKYPLPIHSGPTCDVILKPSPHTRIIFRGHHTVIDGQGLMMWILDVFRALRGETPTGSGWTESVDQFRRISPVREPKWTGGQCVAPTGLPQGKNNRMFFAHMDLPGPVSSLMPRLMLLTAQAARHHHPTGRVVFGVPISLRHRKPGLRSSSNLSRAVYLEVSPDTTITDLHQSIHRHRGFDGKLAPAEAVIPFLPIWILRKALESGHQKGFDSGRYWVSGFVSNFGRFEKNQFSTSDFNVSSVSVRPPASCSTPVFFILLGLDETVSISASMPEPLASRGRLDNLMARIENGLCPGHASAPVHDINLTGHQQITHQNRSFISSDS